MVFILWHINFYFTYTSMLSYMKLLIVDNYRFFEMHIFYQTYLLQTKVIRDR